MKYVTLGKTDLTVSECGFGCIPIIRLSKEDAVKVLRHAFDRGITFFDTANAYRDSEEKIGMAFAGMREKVVLASKTLSAGGNDNAGHGLSNCCLPDVAIRCCGILQNSDGKRAALHWLWCMYGALPLRITSY